MKKKKSQQRKRRYNEEPNGDFRTKKYNNEKKLKIELQYNPAIPAILGIYLKKIKILTWKDICTPMFTAALYTTAKL